jgi:hypothetical protein
MLNAVVSEDLFADGGCPASLRWMEDIRVRSDPRRRDSSLDDASLAIFHSQSGIKCGYRGQDKGQERTLADYLPGSADSRRRLDEITSKYSLSPEDQKRSDDLNRRTAESVERQVPPQVGTTSPSY